MALDAVVSDLLQAQLISDHTGSCGLTRMADRNLTQGLAVVNTTLIQSNGSVADDAATMAALRTAIHVPMFDKA